MTKPALVGTMSIQDRIRAMNLEASRPVKKPEAVSPVDSSQMRPDSVRRKLTTPSIVDKPERRANMSPMHALPTPLSVPASASLSVSSPIIRPRLSHEVARKQTPAPTPNAKLEGKNEVGNTSEMSEATTALAAGSSPAVATASKSRTDQTQKSFSPAEMKGDGTCTEGIHSSKKASRKMSLVDIWRKREQAAMAKVESPRTSLSFPNRSSPPGASPDSSSRTPSRPLIPRCRSSADFDEKKEDYLSDDGDRTGSALVGVLDTFQPQSDSDQLELFGTPSFKSEQVARTKAIQAHDGEKSDESTLFGGSATKSHTLRSTPEHKSPQLRPRSSFAADQTSHSSLSNTTALSLSSPNTPSGIEPLRRARVTDRWIKRGSSPSPQISGMGPEKVTGPIKTKILDEVSASDEPVPVDGCSGGPKMEGGVEAARQHPHDSPASPSSSTSPSSCSNSPTHHTEHSSPVVESIRGPQTKSEAKLEHPTHTPKTLQRWPIPHSKRAIQTTFQAKNVNPRTEIKHEEDGPVDDDSKIRSLHVLELPFPSPSCTNDDERKNNADEEACSAANNLGERQQQSSDPTDLTRGIVLRRWTRRSSGPSSVPSRIGKNEINSPKPSISTPERRIFRNRAFTPGDNRSRLGGNGGTSKLMPSVDQTFVKKKGNNAQTSTKYASVTSPVDSISTESTAIDVDSPDQLRPTGHHSLVTPKHLASTDVPVKAPDSEPEPDIAPEAEVSDEEARASDAKVSDEGAHCFDEEAMDRQSAPIGPKIPLGCAEDKASKSEITSEERRGATTKLDIIESVNQWKKTKPITHRFKKEKTTRTEPYTPVRKSPGRVKQFWEEAKNDTPDRKKSQWLKMGQAHTSRVYTSPSGELDERVERVELVSLTVPECYTSGRPAASIQQGAVVPKCSTSHSTFETRKKVYPGQIFSKKKVVTTTKTDKTITSEAMIFPPSEVVDVVLDVQKEEVEVPDMQKEEVEVPDMQKEEVEKASKKPSWPSLPARKIPSNTQGISRDPNYHAPPFSVESPESLNDELSIDSGTLSHAFMESLPDDEMNHLSIAVSVDAGMSRTIEALSNDPNCAPSPASAVGKIHAEPGFASKPIDPPSEYASLCVSDSDSLIASNFAPTIDTTIPPNDEQSFSKRIDQDQNDDRDLAIHPSGEGSAFSVMSSLVQTPNSSASVFSARASKIMREKKQRKNLPGSAVIQSEAVACDPRGSTRQTATFYDYEVPVYDGFSANEHSEFENETSVSAMSMRREPSLSPDVSTYSSNTLLQTFDSNLTPTTRSDTARRNFSFGSDTTGASSNYYSVDASENESTYTRRHKRRERKKRSSRRDHTVKDMIADQFVSASNNNVEAFRSAYQSLSFGQIANDLKEEAGTVLNLNRLATDINQGMSVASESINKLVGSDIFTPGMIPFSSPKDNGSVDEDVAIEVEYIESDNDLEETSDLDISQGRSANGTTRRYAM